VRARLIRSTLLVAGSSLFAAYLLELVVVVTAPQPEGILEIAAKRGIPFDERSRLDVIRTLERDDPNVAPPVGAKTVLDEELRAGEALPIFPLGGLSNTKIVGCNEGGFWSIYQNDEHGFNNPLGLVSELRAATLVLIGVADRPY
jgi:hypothetical protein